MNILVEEIRYLKYNHTLHFRNTHFTLNHLHSVSIRLSHTEDGEDLSSHVLS